MGTFSQTSPLTTGLKELRQVIFDGLHSGDLQSISTYQPDWYAHILWGLYKVCDTFFQHRLSKADLLEGETLANPLTMFNLEIAKFTVYIRLQTPASLLTTPPPPTHTNTPAPPHDTANGGGKQPYKHQGPGGGRGVDKCVHFQPPPDAQLRGPYWRENPKFDQNLKTTKNTILNTHGCTNLSQLLQAAGTTILGALTTIGCPSNKCRCYTLWGGCSDKTCQLVHDDTVLNPQQASKIATMFKEGLTKIQGTIA